MRTSPGPGLGSATSSSRRACTPPNSLNCTTRMNSSSLELLFMRVVQFNEFGGVQALRLEEVAEPKPGPGDVLIKVNAVGLNFFDTLVLRDKYQVSPPLPFS